MAYWKQVSEAANEGSPMATSFQGLQVSFSFSTMLGHSQLLRHGFGDQLLVGMMWSIYYSQGVAQAGLPRGPVPLRPDPIWFASGPSSRRFQPGSQRYRCSLHSWSGRVASPACSSSRISRCQSFSKYAQPMFLWRTATLLTSLVPCRTRDNCESARSGSCWLTM